MVVLSVKQKLSFSRYNRETALEAPVRHAAPQGTMQGARLFLETPIGDFQKLICREGRWGLFCPKIEPPVIELEAMARRSYQAGTKLGVMCWRA
jgi:hypothetical protein